MGKATSRKIRRQLERNAVARKRAEEQQKTARLRGFKPAGTGDMLREVAKTRTAWPRGGGSA